MRITLKGLAQFMTSRPARQRKILKDFKFPDPEGHAKALYYAEARKAVHAFHSQGNDVGILVRTSLRLERRAVEEGGASARRLRNNVTALTQYATHFVGQLYEVLADRRLQLEYGPVVITVVPDLHVRERRREKIVKVEFSKDEPSPLMIQIITQGMLQAADQAGIDLRSGDALYIDVRRGALHRGGRTRAALARDIEAACMNIADMWDSI
jgi:hypothetical protein